MAKMPQWHRRTCKVCELPETAVGPISGRGYCETHAIERMVANNVQISEKRGPYFDSWRRRQYLAAVRQLLDDPQAGR